MLKEILKNYGVWVFISFCLFAVFCFVQEANVLKSTIIYNLLRGVVYLSILLYIYSKITTAIKVAATEEVPYGNPGD